MRKIIALFVLTASVSLIQAGEGKECADSKAACPATKAAAASKAACTEAAKATKAAAKDACCPTSKKAVKRVQATAKGGNLG